MVEKNAMPTTCVGMADTPIETHTLPDVLLFVRRIGDHLDIGMDPPRDDAA
jgi:hypothetical protein